MIAAAAPRFHRAHSSGIPRPYLAHVPAGIEWAAIVRAAWQDYARWYIGQVIFQRFRVHDLTPDDWCPMAAKFCNQFIPKNVLRPLIEGLKENGIIECDERYTPPTGGRKGRCKHYRIGKAYRNWPLVAIELRNPDLLKHIEACRQLELDAVTGPIHVLLRNWVERMEVLPTAPYGDPVLDRIRIGDCWFVVCEQGRVHTPATNIARCYRKHIRLAGHELVAVDVSCSQPSLLGVTLKKTVAGTGSGPSATAITAATRNDGFLNDCLSGTVYDRFAGALGTAREVAKSELLALVFGAPYRFNRDKARAFASVYPVTWDQIYSTACSLYVRGGELARLMQVVESRLMIQGVAARFLRDCPDVPLLTCHDALLVPPFASDHARSVILDEWKRNYRVTPAVKVTPWTY